MAFGDGNFELPVAVDQCKGSIRRSFGIGSKERNREVFAPEGQTKELAGFEFGEFGAGDVGENIAVMVNIQDLAFGLVGHDGG